MADTVITLDKGAEAVVTGSGTTTLNDTTITLNEGAAVVLSAARSVGVTNKTYHPENGEFPRRVEPLVGINGVNVWGDIKDYVTDFTYTDVATGATDSLEIEMFDLDEHWLNDWLVDTGTELNAKIKFVNWEKQGDEKLFDCGLFLVDELSVKGIPFDVTIKSVTLPVQGTKNTKKWENITISAIAQDICNHLGTELIYYADDVTLKQRQQSQQTDINFLFSLCKEYGFGMKVYRKKVVIFDLQKQDEAMPVNAGDIYYIQDIAEAGSVSLKDTQDGRYTGVKALYKPEKQDNSLECFVGTSEKYLTIENAGTTRQEAEIKAKAALYNANTAAVKLKFKNETGLPFYSGNNYYIYGLGKYSGAYGTDKVTHTITGSASHSQTVEMHAIALEKDRRAETVAADNTVSGGVDGSAGTKIELSGVPLYVSSTATSAVRYISGTYYLYDGKDLSGRYRICEAGEAGKTPVGNHVTGYIDSKYI